MSFTLTYRDIANPHFLAGVRKLVQSDKWKDPKTAYNLAKVGRLLDQELKTFHALRFQFQKKWKDSPSGDVDMEAEAEKFGDVSFVVECHRVDFKDLADKGLSPLEIGALEPLLDNLPA